MRHVAFVVGVGLISACSRRSADPPEEQGVRPETISVPSSKGIGRATPAPPLDISLTADEGAIEVVAPLPTTVGVATTARIRVVPGAGFHINTRYPFVVTLANADGVTVKKTRLEGGRGGRPGDAEILGEAGLSIPITVTPTVAGDHTLSGSINFGICKSDVCLSRAMPVTLSVVASR